MRRLLLFPAMIALLLVSGCGEKPRHSDADAPPAKHVATALAEPSEALSFEEHMGSIVAQDVADIETKVQARVDRIAVNLGSRVRRGDILAELDTREARARVQQARALLEQASADFKRYDALFSQRVATQQEHEVVKARQAVAEASLQEAEAMLSYAQIEAPFDGTVTHRFVDIGDLALPGKPLFRLEKSGALQLVVGLPESKRDRVRVGDSVQVAVSVSDSLIPAIVAEISPSADPASRTFVAKITISEDPRIRGGQFARLLLPSGTETGLFIPRSALVHRGQLELVYAVTADNHASLRLVRTGRQFPDKIEILSGLEQGERVVIEEPAELTDGELVEAGS